MEAKILLQLHLMWIWCRHSLLDASSWWTFLMQDNFYAKNFG